MKNSSSKNSFHNIHSTKEKNILESQTETTHSSRKAVEKNMTEQLIAPPARVWEKIERILDQQDERRNQANEILSATFTNKNTVVKRKKVYWATAAGVTVVAGILFIVL
jgi:hypothetical protein